MSGMETDRSASDPHAVALSPVSMPARFSATAPVKRIPFENFRESPSLPSSPCEPVRPFPELNAEASAESRLEKMVLNSLSSRSSASAVWYSDSLLAWYSRLLCAAIRTASRSPISSAFVPTDSLTPGCSPSEPSSRRFSGCQ